MSNQIYRSHKDIPSIDVIIPVFNCDKYILNALHSIECQTLKPKKIIVVDDGSTDNTASLILNYKSRIPIQYIKKENRGLPSARNAGIKRSISEFVALLDADDEWHEGKLEKQLNIFQTTSFNNLGVVYCNYNIIDERGDLSNKNKSVELDKTLRGKIHKKLMEGRPIISSGSGVLIRKECFNKVGLFDERLKAVEDWDMWIRISKYYEFDYIDEKLVKIRNHEKNMQNDEYHIFSNELILYNKWAEKTDDIASKYFADRLCERIIDKVRMCNFFEMIEYINTANRELTASTKKKLFATTFNSLELYIFAKVIIRTINKIKKTFRKTVGNK